MSRERNRLQQQSVQAFGKLSEQTLNDGSLYIDMFRCDKCGLCCMNVDKSPDYAHLDRGDGTCLYLDVDSRLCTIYDTRPIICNVDAMYQHFFSKYMSKEDYYNLNYAACKRLKETHKILR